MRDEYLILADQLEENDWPEAAEAIRELLRTNQGLKDRLDIQKAMIGDRRWGHWGGVNHAIMVDNLRVVPFDGRPTRMQAEPARELSVNDYYLNNNAPYDSLYHSVPYQLQNQPFAVYLRESDND